MQRENILTDKENTERNKIMKIIKTGTTYKVYGENLVVLDNLPAQTYKVGCGQFTGFFLEKQHDLEIKEDKIYGVHEEKANKVLNRFEKSRKNLGVILSGDKGIGKSLFARLLAQKAIQNGIPVILVDDFIPGIDDFLNDIKNEALVLFDEFDKTFAKSKDKDPQSKMLSLFDGTSSGKKLFVVTCNNYRDLNEYLINRPGRFHFHFRFEYPTADEEMQHGLDVLKENNNVVDYIITHSPSTSELYLMGGKGLYKIDVLTNYLEEVKTATEYKKHLFGHMHVNKAINDRDICLYEQIIRIL